MVGSPKRCPACGATGHHRGLFHKNVPAFLFPVEKEALDFIEAGAVEIVLCGECGHMFRPHFDADLLENIYGVMYKYYPYDANESMNDSYRIPFFRFFDLVGDHQSSKSMSTLLEIGCSKPSNLKPFVESGFDCTGIDPSPLTEVSKGKKNIRIISEYYEKKYFSEPFNIVISRFNLEHITDLSAHTSKLWKDTMSGGRVIVQVPNLEYYIENRQPFFAAHEHIHYFTPKSARLLFERFGFEVISSCHLDQPSILLCAVKPNVTRKILGDPLNDLKKYKQSINLKEQQLRRHINGKKSIVCYGCGLALYWVLEVVQEYSSLKVSVVDDNDALVGKWVPVYTHQIERPSAENMSEPDLVILTLNPLYHDAVINKIKSLGRPVTLLKIAENGVNTVQIS